MGSGEDSITMSEEDNGTRRKYRESDNVVDKFTGFLNRYKLIGVGIWILLGYVVSLGTAKLNDLESRITALEVNASKTTELLDKVMRSNCMDRTLHEQALINMQCPVNMFKRDTTQ